jgi:hypothetical protein
MAVRANSLYTPLPQQVPFFRAFAPSSASFIDRPETMAVAAVMLCDTSFSCEGIPKPNSCRFLDRQHEEVAAKYLCQRNRHDC